MYISVGEIIVIALVVFFLFSNPNKLLERKEIVKSVVKDATGAVSDFKQAVDELASELKEEKEELFESVMASEPVPEGNPSVKEQDLTKHEELL